jgi:hypothetical protein
LIIAMLFSNLLLRLLSFDDRNHINNCIIQYSQNLKLFVLLFIWPRCLKP